jgi:hypothetical protein
MGRQAVVAGTASSVRRLLSFERAGLWFLPDAEQAISRASFTK